jgi:hypothetical protein
MAKKTSAKKTTEKKATEKAAKPSKASKKPKDEDEEGDEDDDEDLDLDAEDDEDEEEEEDLDAIDDDMLASEDEEAPRRTPDDVEKMLRETECEPCPGSSSKLKCKIRSDYQCPPDKADK